MSSRLVHFDKMNSSLRIICKKRLNQLYSDQSLSEAKKRLEYELQALNKVENGERAFIEAMDFFDKMRNLCKGVGNGYLPYVSFRGPVLSSLIAYITGISEYDPIKCGFDPWIFYEKPSVIEFNCNFPIKTLHIIKDYDLKKPECIIRYLGRDESIIDKVEECTSVGESAYILKNLELLNQVIRCFFATIDSGSDQVLEYLVGFDRKFVPHVNDVINYLSKIGRLPQNHFELARLNGFMHCSLLDENYLGALNLASRENDNIYDGMISFSEDVYDMLIGKGCDSNKAKIIARKVKNEKRILDNNELGIIEDYCGKTYVQMASNVKHLFCKSQCFQNGWVEARLMYMINNHLLLTLEAYDMVCKAIYNKS